MTTLNKATLVVCCGLVWFPDADFLPGVFGAALHDEVGSGPRRDGRHLALVLRSGLLRELGCRRVQNESTWQQGNGLFQDTTPDAFGLKPI